MRIAFDIGANIGVYTDWFLRNGFEKIIAVEPSSDFATLQKNFENQSKVVLLHNALSDKSGVINFWECPMCTPLSTCCTEWMTESRFSNKNLIWNKTEIECLTLDNLIEKYGIPSFVKIDTEGHEYEVICGLTKKIDALFCFEWAEEQFDKVERIVKYVQNLGYHLFQNTMVSDDLNKQPSDESYVSWKELNLIAEINPSRQELGGMIYFK